MEILEDLKDRSGFCFVLEMMEPESIERLLFCWDDIIYRNMRAQELAQAKVDQAFKQIKDENERLMGVVSSVQKWVEKMHEEMDRGEQSRRDWIHNNLHRS